MIVNLYNYSIEFCDTILQKSNNKIIGGPGIIVEIDESRFGKENFIKVVMLTESRCSVESNVISRSVFLTLLRTERLMPWLSS